MSAPRPVFAQNAQPGALDSAHPYPQSASPAAAAVSSVPTPAVVNIDSASLAMDGIIIINGSYFKPGEFMIYPDGSVFMEGPYFTKYQSERVSHFLYYQNASAALEILTQEHTSLKDTVAKRLRQDIDAIAALLKTQKETEENLNLQRHVNSKHEDEIKEKKNQIQRLELELRQQIELQRQLQSKIDPTKNELEKSHKRYVNQICATQQEKTKIYKLEFAIECHTKNIANLQREKLELTSQLQKVGGELKQTQNTLIEETQKFEKLIKQRGEYEAELVGQLGQLQQSDTALKKTIEQLNEELNIVKAELAKNQKILQGATQKLGKVQTEKNLQKMLAEKENQIADLKKSINTTQEYYRELYAVYEETKGNLEKESLERVNECEHIGKLSRELYAVKNEKHDLNEKVKRFDGVTIFTLHNLFEIAKTCDSTTKASLENLSRQIQATTKETSALPSTPTPCNSSNSVRLFNPPHSDRSSLTGTDNTNIRPAVHAAGATSSAASSNGALGGGYSPLSPPPAASSSSGAPTPAPK